MDERIASWGLMICDFALLLVAIAPAAAYAIGKIPFQMTVIAYLAMIVVTMNSKEGI